MKWDAEDYSRHSAAQQTWARELITKLHLKDDESVLDIVQRQNSRASSTISPASPAGSMPGTRSRIVYVTPLTGSFQ